MSESWYCLAFGVELGPMSWADLIERAARGDLQPDSRIRCSAGGPWVSENSIDGLFAPTIENRAPAGAWYCEILGAELGPMGFDELRLLAERGNLRAENRVRCDNGAWRPANQFAELSEALSVVSATDAQHETPETALALEGVVEPPILEPHPPEPQTLEPIAAESAPAPIAKAPATPAEQRPPKNRETPKPPRYAPTEASRRVSLAPQISRRTIAYAASVAATVALVYLGYLAFSGRPAPGPDYRQVASSYRQVYDELKRFRQAPNPQAEIGLRFQFSRHVASLRKQFQDAAADSEAGQLGLAGAQLAEMLGDFNAQPGSPQAQHFAESEQRFLTLLEGVRPAPAAAETSR